MPTTTRVVQAAYDIADFLGAHDLPAHAVYVHADRINVEVAEAPRTREAQTAALAAIRAWATHLGVEPTVSNIAGYWHVSVYVGVHRQMGDRTLYVFAAIPQASAGLDRAQIDEFCQAVSA